MQWMINLFADFCFYYNKNSVQEDVFDYGGSFLWIWTGACMWEVSAYCWAIFPTLIFRPEIQKHVVYSNKHNIESGSLHDYELFF